MTQKSDDETVRGGSGEMFDAIAERYDLLNRIISLGIDQRWRRKTVAALELSGEATVLDLATGTGDLALMIARLHPEVDVIGTDPSTGMLAVGTKKVESADVAHRVKLRPGSAEQIEFEDSSVDGITMAFGIRNAVDRDLSLREMNRVTRPGGKIAILELGEPRSGLVGPLARFHVHTVVPTVGAWLSGRSEYRYLQRSIAAFPPSEEFGAQMRAAGLLDVDITDLTFGVCHLYVGTAA